MRMSPDLTLLLLLIMPAVPTFTSLPILPQMACTTKLDQTRYSGGILLLAQIT